MLKTIIAETMKGGKYRLDSPSFIFKPKRVYHDSEEYLFVISGQDNKGRKFTWAIDQLSKVLATGRVFSGYRVVVLMHLFDAKDLLSKTPEFLSLSIDTESKQVEQTIFTERNLDTLSYSYESVTDLKNLVLQNTGWKNDRTV